MNFNSILNMILRRVIGRLINKGIDAGIDLAAQRGRANNPDRSSAPSDEDRARARQAKDLARKARKSAKITRRLF